MAQNDVRDSSSDASEDDASPDNSDVEEDKVVSVFSWHVQMLIFECCFVLVCCTRKSCFSKCFISVFILGSTERR